MIKILAICMFIFVAAGCSAVEDAIEELETDVAEEFPTVGKVIEEVKTAVAEAFITPVPSGDPDYIATGDSVAAGDDLAIVCLDEPCANRRLAYPQLVVELARAQYDPTLTLTDVSCSGATTWSYLRDTQCRASGPQATYLEKRASWVTITVGANDLLNWIKSNLRCLLDEDFADLLGQPREDCDLHERVIAPFEEQLREILVKATGAADIVVVTQYYRVFSPLFAPILPYDYTDAVNQGIDLLDESIARVSSEFGDRVVVVDLRPVFATHEWGDSDPYIARLHHCIFLEPVCRSVIGIHPNARGQQAIAARVWAEVQRRLPPSAKP